MKIFAPSMKSAPTAQSAARVLVLSALAMSLGASRALGGNPATDAFGMIAMIAMAPLITLQILGLIFKYMENKKKLLDREQLALEESALKEPTPQPFDPAQSNDAKEDAAGGRS